MSIDDFGALFLVDIINALEVSSRHCFNRGMRRDDPLTASDAKDVTAIDPAF